MNISMAFYVYISCLAFLISINPIQKVQACTALFEENQSDETMLTYVQGQTIDENSVELTCLEYIVSNNYFATANHLISQAFSQQTNSNKKQLENAQTLVIQALQKVRQGQDTMMEIFEETQMLTSYTSNIPEISPSIKWSQNDNTVQLEVKFSTRIDSPACMDLYEKEIKLEDSKTLIIHALCRNDQRILNYIVKAQLYGDVELFASADSSEASSDSDSDDIFDSMPTHSKVKDWSAGRVQIDLVKTDGQRWKTLFNASDQQKYQHSIGKWWDKIGKGGDDNDGEGDTIDDLVDDLDIFDDEPAAKPKSPKKKKGKKKGKKSKGKKGKTFTSSGSKDDKKDDSWLGGMRDTLKDWTGV